MQIDSTIRQLQTCFHFPSMAQHCCSCADTVRQSPSPSSPSPQDYSNLKWMVQQEEAVRCLCLKGQKAKLSIRNVTAVLNSYKSQSLSRLHFSSSKAASHITAFTSSLETWFLHVDAWRVWNQNCWIKWVSPACICWSTPGTDDSPNITAKLMPTSSESKVQCLSFPAACLACSSHSNLYTCGLKTIKPFPILPGRTQASVYTRNSSLSYQQQRNRRFFPSRSPKLNHIFTDLFKIMTFSHSPVGVL